MSGSKRLRRAAKETHLHFVEPTDFERGAVVADLALVLDACARLRKGRREVTVEETTLRRQCADEIEALVHEAMMTLLGLSARQRPSI